MNESLSTPGSTSLDAAASHKKALHKKFEVEQKFRLADPTEFEARLTAMGVSFGPVVEQSDEYFCAPGA